MNDISVIILTFNEEIHLERCLENVSLLTKSIFIIDSFSNDKTIFIAKKYKANIFQNEFISQSHQLQWAMENCNITTKWIFRIDADEYLTPELIIEINDRVSRLDENITGIYLKRRHYFMDTWIRFGGRFPLLMLRIWKNKCARVEKKWMDEQMILLEGESITFNKHFVDHNLNSITWMITKHNNYATREAIEQLKEEYNLIAEQGFLDKKQALTNATHRTRLFKNILYRKELLLIRSVFYFLYRYFILLGFLDGRAGLIYHFLQGFWYRFLCDAKIIEIKHLADKKNISITKAIEEYSGYKI